jgi:hypothetical protein
VLTIPSHLHESVIKLSPEQRRDRKTLCKGQHRSRSSTLRIHSHQTNSVQSKPAGPGSAPEIVGASLSLTTFNDTFSWWAFTARAEGARPKCAAIALRGCMPASSCLSLVTSSALQRRRRDTVIFQPPQPRSPAPQPNARTTLAKNTHLVYWINRSTPRNGLFSLSELVAKFTQRSAHGKSRSKKCGRPAPPPRRLVELGLKAAGPTGPSRKPGRATPRC